MKKSQKIILIVTIVIAAFLAFVIGGRAYEDWKGARELKAKRDLVRDNLACIEYTIPEGFYNRATGDSYEYEWWEYKEGSMQANIDFFAWEKKDYFKADSSIEDYVSNLKANGATVTSPIEDADIGNIHGKKAEIQKGKDYRETIHYLDTEKGLLRIVYSVYDSNMFEGEDWETNRCYTCQQEFFDSLKENTGEQKQDARANEDNFVNPDSHEENMAEQGQDAQVKEESFEYRAIKQLCSDWSFTDAVLEDHYHVNKSDLEDSEIPVFKANEDGSYTLTLIDGEEYAGTWEVLPEEYYEEMDGILYFYSLSIDGNASDEEGIVITAQIGNEGVDESGNAHQLLVSFGVDETIQKVYAFEK